MVQDGDKWLWVKMWWNLWILVVTGAYTWLRVVMGGFGVDTGGFGWLLVIVNNPKIIGPKMSKIIKK